MPRELMLCCANPAPKHSVAAPPFLLRFFSYRERPHVADATQG